MNEKILQLITEYGLEATVIALAINFFVGLLKQPIKAWASKMEDGTKLTRYLVFLPVIVGLLLTLLYTWVVYEALDVNRQFVTLWISSSSLSLTFYAFWEKLFPTKASILKDYEIEENKKLIEQIKTLADKKFVSGETTENVESKIKNTMDSEMKEEMLTSTYQMGKQSDEKIILRGNRNAKIGVKEESV